MKTKYALLAGALIFAVGSATYLRSTEGRGGKPFVASPFVITYTRYRQDAPEERRTTIRLVNSHGRSLAKGVRRDGTEERHVVQQYQSDEWASWADRRYYERSTKVVRKEQFLGVTAYVYRQDIGDGQTLEFWHAPETGPVPLKQIVESADGDVQITEAASLEFREVSDEELEPRPDLLWEPPRR